MTMHADQHSEHVAWGEILTREAAVPLVLVSLGIWLHAADSLLLATMIPQILADIGGDRFVAWTIATYEIGSIVAGACAAIATMRAGIRNVMTCCAVVFALGCAASMMATNMPVLLAGRVLQGLGGGGLTAMTFISIAILFSSRHQARVMAVISALWGASAFMGPLIGAFFVEYFTWRWGFGFFLVQALILALWIWFTPGISQGRNMDNAPTLPLKRLILLVAGTTMIASAGIEVSFPQTPLLILGAFTLLLLFLRQDARSGDNRMLPANAFHLRDRAGAALLMWFAMAAGVMGLMSYGPVLLASLHGVEPIVVGYILAGASFGWTVSAIVVSGSPERLDRFWITLGLALVACSVTGMYFAAPAGPVWLIAGLTWLEGVGFGSAYTFIQRRLISITPENEQARVTGAMPTVARFGYAVGAATCGIMANAAGFSLEASPEILQTVARYVFAGSLPFIALGLWAMRGFVRG
ncbi:MFS transporter [Halocynthiibacter styelae]|uniref:MFS transporter n=1 Tax=Halocynthiibacter styelae TaxID=2761955 RepID=A0A8J7J660_9RHOB|nr:MFS transporter [Paenihalocynthiibacter styelae]MBI1494280.1 MFS transporter [Paenihalocynthiibacter styelae]